MTNEETNIPPQMPTVRCLHCGSYHGALLVCPCQQKAREPATLAPPFTYDPVRKPYHYNSDPSGIECIQITEHRNFCIGNAIKYLWRAGIKGADLDPSRFPPREKLIEDLKKAVWYIEREIKRQEAMK